MEYEVIDMQEVRSLISLRKIIFCKNTENAVKIDSLSHSRQKDVRNAWLKLFSPHFLRKITAKPHPGLQHLINFSPKHFFERKILQEFC